MKTSSRFLACFLILILMISCFPVQVCSTELSEPETAPSTEPLPEETSPEEMLSEESAPPEPPSEEPLPEETLSEETIPQESSPDELQQEILPADDAELPPPAGPGLFFGLLNGHTNISEGSAAPEDVYTYASRLPGMDFFAVSDHSDSFDNAGSGSIGTDGSAISADWAAGKAAASASTANSFVGIYGYEMNWPSQMKTGHISTFGTPGFESWTNPPYSEYKDALEHYYDTLSGIPDSVSQFNHPGTQYGTFSNFSHWSPSADQAVSLLEVDFREDNPFRHYINALDQGWHLAPAAAQSIFSGSWQDTGVRTAVYAQSLTEADLLSALKQCRAYATEDPDLEILYSMDGHFMGSRLDLRHIGETADLSVTLRDPTDSAIGLTEVITNFGEAITQQTLSAASGTLTFSLPPESGYYFLRITQPDGDQAVTAPIWVDAEEELGITSLSCETTVPVQNEPIRLALTVTNGESAEFLVDSLDVLADGVPVLTDHSLTAIPARQNVSHVFTASLNCAGLTNLTVRLSGRLEGSPRSLEASLGLNFRQSEQVTAIMADGSHGNVGLEHLNLLKTMATEDSIRFTVAETSLSAEQLKDCRFLLVTPPTQPFSDAFLAAAAEFAGFGGSLILCGQSDREDGAVSELNRLLAAIGSGIRINRDTVLDPVNNAGSSRLNSDLLDLSQPWCQGISRDQVYRVISGCTITPGSGVSLVTGRRTTASSEDPETEDVTLLACEPLCGGGTVFAAGSLFLSDDCLAEPANIWDEPYANRNLARNLLNIGGDPIPLSTIQDVRLGAENGLFRIRGYVTAGTANPYNRFPDTLYLQDDTGGIAVSPFPDNSIGEGTPVEITGYARTQNGSRILKISSWEVLDSSCYQYQAMTGPWTTLLDPGKNENRLVCVEGKCLEVYCREDNSLAGCLLEDSQGNTAIVKIEDYIENGSDGENRLHKTIRKNRTVRAAGLLHRDEYGDTVIRVRNCEEVSWVLPRNYQNPKTGDISVLSFLLLMSGSLAGICLLIRRKRP